MGFIFCRQKAKTFHLDFRPDSIEADIACRITPELHREQILKLEQIGKSSQIQEGTRGEVVQVSQRTTVSKRYSLDWDYVVERPESVVRSKRLQPRRFERLDASKDCDVDFRSYYHPTKDIFCSLISDSKVIIALADWGGREAHEFLIDRLRQKKKDEHRFRGKFKTYRRVFY